MTDPHALRLSTFRPRFYVTNKHEKIKTSPGRPMICESSDPHPKTHSINKRIDSHILYRSKTTRALSVFKVQGCSNFLAIPHPIRNSTIQHIN